MNETKHIVPWIIKSSNQIFLLILPYAEKNLRGDEACAIAGSLLHGTFQISPLSVGVATIDYTKKENQPDHSISTASGLTGRIRSAYRITFSDGMQKVAVEDPGFTSEEIIEMEQRNGAIVLHVHQLQYALFPIQLKGHDQTYQHDGRHIKGLGLAPNPPKFGPIETDSLRLQDSTTALISH